MRVRKSPSGEPIQHFDEACASLLREVLTTAKVINPASSNTPKAKSHAKSKSLAVIDVGFGCGDQTWELSRLIKLHGWSDLAYVGLTLNQSQLQAASRRLDREIGEIASTDKRSLSSFRLFGTNAANPASWSPGVRQAIHGLADQEFTEKWLLGLDCLYHFAPSRRPLLKHAAQTMGTNFMAFDLLLNKSASLRRKIVARLIGTLMGCPWRAFLTEEEYVRQLVACGYDRKSIVIRDVSEDVFVGLVKYLDRQEMALAHYGISLGGGFKLARGLFRWFTRTGVIKGAIVVARLCGEDSAKR